MGNKLNKNQRAALLAKELGYTHIATVVKSVFSTTYHNVQDVDYVIERGWEGAPNNGPYGWQGPVGTIGSEVDWGKTIDRQELFTKLDNK